ncbi:uncharacterized protein LOC119100752 [Pollicipes pollicipes]|uniref:uncharacterized protein LOC119100752 n=1 Tax=Pollicipes pollicipes TaxID=41117 RepID=UPI0018851013|nr:uncharacterized protein LOC119100752 [Pollicipes pollicipes]
MTSAAELRARQALLRRSLDRWRHHRALAAAERVEAAQHWRESRLAAWALRRWRRYVHQQRLKEQAAADLSQLQRVQAALRTWQASVALARVRRRQKMHRAQLCHVR